MKLMYPQNQMGRTDAPFHLTVSGKNKLLTEEMVVVKSHICREGCEVGMTGEGGGLKSGGIIGGGGWTMYL